MIDREVEDTWEVQGGIWDRVEEWRDTRRTVGDDYYIRLTRVTHTFQK
jgi:hypothetical protein